MNRDSLLSVAQCEDLDADAIKRLYAAYVNPNVAQTGAKRGIYSDPVSHAEGVWIFLRDGRKILDCTGGVGVLNHGHNHQRILEARVRFQANKRMEVHKSFLSPYVAGLSHNLAMLLPGDLNFSYFCNSGAEAIEGAMKMAYRYHRGERQVILHSDIAFHGRTIGSGSLMGNRNIAALFPFLSQTDAFVFDGVTSLQDKVRAFRRNDRCDVYAIVVEPFSASTLRACSSEFLKSARDLCNAEDIVLIFDEIYTGWAKTGPLFNFMRTEVIPDIVTFSKSFGGGKASISGYTARTSVFSRAYPDLRDIPLQTTTYYGFGEETVTALESIHISLDDDYSAKAASIERRLGAGLHDLKERYANVILEVRGCGALWGLVFDSEHKDVAKLVRFAGPKTDPSILRQLIPAAVSYSLYKKHGVLTMQAANTTPILMISPSLTVQEHELDLALHALESVLHQGLTRVCLDYLAT
jgi:putrescine aminotransferase